MSKKKTILTILAAAMLITAFGSDTAYAGDWKNSGNQWIYDNGDGTILKNGWYWLDGNYDGYAESYYFDSNGIMASDKWVDGYQVNSDGAWIINGVVQKKSSISPGTDLIKSYEDIELCEALGSDEIVDCGSYYELRNVHLLYLEKFELDGIIYREIAEGDIDTHATVYLSKSADIEWMTGDMVTHYTPSGYAGRYDGSSTVLTSLRLWSPKFDSNGWIIGGYDMDAG